MLKPGTGVPGIRAHAEASPDRDGTDSRGTLAAEGLRQELQMTTATEQPAHTATAKGIQVTDKALVKVRSAMAKEGISPEQGGLRLGVQGGGCSGLSYNVRFDTQPRERDRIFQYGDIRVFVDPKSFIYLHGMILDYQETLMQQGFVFVNPQATKSCGCGTSFSA